jgi:hypothetical protein
MSVLLYIATFILGGIAGYVIAKSYNPDKRVANMEVLLRDLQARHDQYQQHVNGHFQETADLVNALTSSYKALHQHLVNGAQNLGKDPKISANANPASAFVQLNDNIKAEAPFSPYSYPEPIDGELISPPRDYATKNPNEKGTLDENFGFNK